MLSIAKMTGSSVNYYKSLSRYYRKGSGADDDNDPGPDGAGIGMTTTNAVTRWIGGAIEALGLDPAKQIVGTHFERLCDGFHPITKEPLVQKAGTKPKSKQQKRAELAQAIYNARCPGWDFTFSDPKSVSIVWAAGSEKQKAEIIDARYAAVAEALAYLEKNLAFVRVGKAGVDLRHEHAKLVIGCFQDFVNREVEPQLHTHCTVINLGLRDDGKFNALDPRIFYPWKKVLGAIYRSALCRRLIELGYQIEKDGTSFAIVGVPQELCDENSTRRKQVVAACGSNYNAINAAEASKETRLSKAEMPPLSVLESDFRTQCEDYGFGPEVIERIKNRKQAAKPPLKKLVSRAITELFENSETSHATYQQLLFASLVESAPHGYRADETEDEVIATIDLSVDIIPLTNGSFTTRDQLQRERKLLQTVDRLKKRKAPWATQTTLDRVLKKIDVSPEQEKAVREICSGGSSFRILEGIAGAGKTKRVLGVAANAFRAHGYDVKAMAPTGVATSQLTDGLTGVKARTVASSLGNWKVPIGQRLEVVASGLFREALPRKLRGAKRKIPTPNPLKLSKKTVLIVDEASMVSIPDFDAIVSRVEKQGGMVIFVGDRAQFPAVKALSPYSYFCRHERLIKSNLLETHRQEQLWQREMVQAARIGDSQALELLRDYGCVLVKDTHEERIEAAVEDWTQFGIDTPEKSTIIASTNDQVQAINLDCQKRRIAAGRLNPKQFLYVRDTSGEQPYVSRVHVGDRVMFTRAKREKGKPPIENGFIGTVEAMKAKKFSVRLDNENLVVLDPKFRHIRLGYCTTEPKSQGATYENAYVVPGSTAEGLFVAVSRGAKRIKVFATTEEISDVKDIATSKLAWTLAAKADLFLAAELLPDGFELAPAGAKPPTEQQIARAQAQDQAAARKKNQAEKSPQAAATKSIPSENATAKESQQLDLKMDLKAVPKKNPSQESAQAVATKLIPTATVKTKQATRKPEQLHLKMNQLPVYKRNPSQESPQPAATESPTPEDREREARNQEFLDNFSGLGQAIFRHLPAPPRWVRKVFFGLTEWAKMLGHGLIGTAKLASRVLVGTAKGSYLVLRGCCLVTKKLWDMISDLEVDELIEGVWVPALVLSPIYAVIAQKFHISPTFVAVSLAIPWTTILLATLKRMVEGVLDIVDDILNGNKSGGGEFAYSNSYSSSSSQQYHVEHNHDDTFQRQQREQHEAFQRQQREQQEAFQRQQQESFQRQQQQITQQQQEAFQRQQREQQEAFQRQQQAAYQQQLDAQRRQDQERQEQQRQERERDAQALRQQQQLEAQRRQQQQQEQQRQIIETQRQSQTYYNQ